MSVVSQRKIIGILDAAFVVFVAAAMIILYSPVGEWVDVEVPITFGILALLSAGARMYLTRGRKKAKAEENAYAFRRWRR
jgi:hypothetical protein